MYEDARKAVGSVQRRAWIVIVMLMMGIAVDSIGAVATFSQVRLLNAIAQGVTLRPGVAASNDARMNLIAGLRGSSYIVTAVVFLIWMVKARHNLPLLGARDLEYSPWWTLGGFLVPILSLVRPYSVMSEIWSASDPNREGEQSWKWRDSPAALRWWWGLFLAMNVCGTILTFVARNKSGEVIPRLIGQSYVGIVKDLIGIPAALVTILVIQSVNGQQAAGLARLRNSEMRCTSPNL